MSTMSWGHGGGVGVYWHGQYIENAINDRSLSHKKKVPESF